MAFLKARFDLAYRQERIAVSERDLIYITQRVEFAAAHRLAIDHWSDEKNQSVFGKCANKNGHGHNYRLEVTFKGQPDPETGLVVHFDKLRALLYELVEVPLDHKNLNEDVPLLKGRLPSSENIVACLWDEIERATEKESYQVHCLSLWSSEKHRVDYYGGLTR